MDYPQYDPNSPVTPLTAAEMEALDTLLQELPTDGAMTLDGVDGFLTALLVGPPAVMATLGTAQWLPMVWGGDPSGGADEAAPFASKRQRKNTVVLVLRHLRHLHHQFQNDLDEWQPIFSVAEQGEDEWADARDWCAGFLQAVDLLPAAWETLWDDPALGPALAPVLMLGGGLDGAAPAAGGDAAEAGDDLDDPVVCDQLSRAVPDAVLRLLARDRGAPAGA